MPDPIHALIDESGDAGTGGKGSRWLVIALVLDLGRSGELAAHLDGIREVAQRQRDFLHFADMKSLSRKLVAYQMLAAAPLSTIIVAIDTAAIGPGQRLAKPGRLYRYGLLLALERGSQIAAALGRPLRVTIEGSDYLDVGRFRRQLEGLRRVPRAMPAMRWEMLDPAAVAVAGKRGEFLLGAADGAAHAFYRAIEPVFAGDPSTAMYADILLPTLWRGPDDSRIFRNGFAFAPPSRAHAYVNETEVLRRWLGEQRQIAAMLWSSAPHGSSRPA